jgi:hypothetical protein
MTKDGLITGRDAIFLICSVLDQLLVVFAESIAAGLS